MGRSRVLRAVRVHGARSRSSPFGAVAVLVFCLNAAACTLDGQTALPTTATPRASVAFEQIDGPPEGVFRKLVHELSREAQARQIAVVSHKEAARFRVRGYVAMHPRGDRTTVVWVWDVYDPDQNRVLRISGEEDAGRTVEDAWGALDDSILRRVSRTSMDQLIAFLSAAPQGARVAGIQDPPSPAAPPSAPAFVQDHMFNVATASDDFAPESYGIFRLPDAGDASSPTDSTDVTATLPQSDIPLPRPRPTRAAAVAYVGH